MAPISFARGAPSPACLEPELLSDCGRVALERDGRTTILSCGTGGGYGPLRELLGERPRGRQGAGLPARRVGCRASSSTWRRSSAASLRGTCSSRAPTYDRPLKLLGWQGVEVVSVEMDDEGLDPDALEAELAPVEETSLSSYTIPTFQNPERSHPRRGAAHARRRALCASTTWTCSRTIQYGLVRYEGTAPRSLHELEGGEHVTFTSSFSKTVAPGLRASAGSFRMVPGALRSAYDDRAVSTYISPPLLPQAIVHELSARGGFDANLERVRRDSRCAANGDARTHGRGTRRAGDLESPRGWVLPLGRSRRRNLERGAARSARPRPASAFVRSSDFFPDGGGGPSSARLRFSYEPPRAVRRRRSDPGGRAVALPVPDLGRTPSVTRPAFAAAATSWDRPWRAPRRSPCSGGSAR